MPEKDIIEKNLKEYLEMAEYAFKNRKFNTAVTLYYKTLVELCDLELVRKLNKIGANHSERFELLRKTSPLLYNIASKLFRFYRDSYSKEISETTASLVKTEVENAKRIVLGSKKN
ncbi:MAG: hypothetical protein KAU20_03165 [Nanoarchaeota archaeon]|nr:hypothetical protein [Nanoarchaeota archaeon]